MNPIKFQQANVRLGPPKDISENECRVIDGYVDTVKSGPLDGARVVITAWKPSEQEIEDLKNGAPIYLTSIGGLMPHFLSTDFETASQHSK